jgi:hypothetical protein
MLGGSRTSSCASPASYPQVWFVSAPFVASGVLIGGLVAALSEGGFVTDRFLFSLPIAVIAFVGQGAIESYRLGRRNDANACHEWLEARDQSEPDDTGPPTRIRRRTVAGSSPVPPP